MTDTQHLSIAAASLVRPNNTTAYAAGNLIGNSTLAGSVLPMAFVMSRDGAMNGEVRRARIKCSDVAWLNSTVRLHLYLAAPTAANGDGAAWSTNESQYLGAMDVTFTRQWSDNSVEGIGVPNEGSEISFIPPDNTLTIYGLLQAESAVTPAASSVWTVTLETLKD